MRLLVTAILLAVGAATVPAQTTTPFGDGAYEVGRDIAAGTYQAPGGSSCFWMVQPIDGTPRVGSSQDRPLVEITRADHSFITTDCGRWEADGKADDDSAELAKWKAMQEANTVFTATVLVAVKLLVDANTREGIYTLARERASLANSVRTDSRVAAGVGVLFEVAAEQWSVRP